MLVATVVERLKCFNNPCLLEALSSRETTISGLLDERI